MKMDNIDNEFQNQNFLKNSEDIMDFIKKDEKS